MTTTDETKKLLANNSLLKRIANHAMLHSSSNYDLGLFNGKVGLTLFFFHYAKYIKNPLYEEFAGELLNEVLTNIHDTLSIRFSSGLTGIAWGIAYLVQQQFIEGDTTEIFQDIDHKIAEYNPLKMQDRSLDTGAGGIAAYVQLRSSLVSDNYMPFDKEYINALATVCPHTWTVREIWESMWATESPLKEVSWKNGLKILLQ